MQKQNMEQQHKRRNSNPTTNTRRTSILEAISTVPGFELVLGNLPLKKSEGYWKDLGAKLGYYGNVGAHFSGTPELSKDVNVVKDMVVNCSQDGIYDIQGSPAFARVGRGRFDAGQGTWEGWIEVGDGGCVKVKVEPVVGKVGKEKPTLPPSPSVSTPPTSPKPPTPPPSSSSPSTSSVDPSYLPTGVITSFTILSPTPKSYPPPPSSRWVPSPPNEVVSTHPNDNAIPQLEWFLPSYPTLLSPTPPTVRSLVKVVPIDNIIDFGEGNYAAFRWTTISAGEDKNYIHELTTWEKVGRGGEEYGAGVWVPVTCAMVTSIPIVGR